MERLSRKELNLLMAFTAYLTTELGLPNDARTMDSFLELIKGYINDPAFPLVTDMSDPIVILGSEAMNKLVYGDNS